MMLKSGTRLGPYEIAASVGAGGMGEVYRARDPRLGRDVAVKVLPGEWARDPERLRRFEQEARAAGMLNHPSILAVYDVGTHDGAPYVVTELLEGETLRSRMGGAALSPRKAIEMAVQIAHGLAAAHQAGVVHRDVKPENLFLTRDGRIKILDFGLAKLRMPDSGPLEAAPDTPTVAQAPTLPPDTGPNQVWGTVGYMSPEQVRGKPVDHRSDLFSFGAVLYEMLTGLRAFRGESTADTMSAILREDPPDIASPGHTLPPALERIVRHCLEKNPDERFQSARDLAFDLETLTGLSGSSAAATAGAARGGGRRRAAAAGLVGAGLLVAGVVGAWWATRDKPGEPDYRQVTFRRGIVENARFTPDGNTIVYSARWDGEGPRVFTARPGSPESRPLDVGTAGLASVSKNGELAIYLKREDVLHAFASSSAARVSLAGGTPREVVAGVQSVEWAPDAESFAVVRRSPQGTRLEFPLGKVLLDLLGDITNVRFAPDGRSLACWVHPQVGDTQGKVVWIPLDGTPRDLTSVWSDAYGLAWGAGGKEIWFTAAREGLDRGLYAVDRGGSVRPIARIPGSLTLHDIAADGRVLLSRDLMRMQMRGRSRSADAERDLSWYDWTYASHVADDGGSVLFSESGEGGGGEYVAYSRPLDGGLPLRIGSGSPTSLSPDGRTVLMIGTVSRELREVPVGAGAVRTIPTGRIDVVDAVWHPDGKRVIVSGPEPGRGVRWYLIEPGKPPRPVTAEGVLPRGAAPSPDGRRLAVSQGTGRIAIHPLEGETAPHTIVVPDTTRPAAPLRWSPDGTSILYAMFPPSVPGVIHRLDLRSGRSTPVLRLQPSDMTGVAEVGGVDVSADGRSYAYSYVHVLSDLYVVSNLR